ncbi:MAG: hypothetical protein PWP08_99 [Methanofollis sp.]|nr:hypothetical protein [Methanofollis sp.]
MAWQPPGKNCGLCGAQSCEAFLEQAAAGALSYTDCPFYSEEEKAVDAGAAVHADLDIVGNPYDFVLDPLPGEPSARKIVLPFRPDLVEKWGIETGEIVVGRPMGAGCPVQHVLRVIEANPVTGLLTTHVVGPRFSRDASYHDVQAYHMIGFEGIARPVRRPPVFGLRQRFLPGYCMMALSHTGVINMVVERPGGLRVRVEDIII